MNTLSRVLLAAACAAACAAPAAAQDSAARRPGIVMDVRFDDKGDLDRKSVIVEVWDGKQVVRDVLPPLSAKKS